MPLNLETIRERHKNRKKKSLSADGVFYSLFQASYELTAASVKALPDHKYLDIKKIAFNNFIVNTVTALEVYFKTTIDLTNKWEEKGYATLLKEKITLSEAYDLFNKERVTREYIISQYFSFQNIESVHHVFSSLTGKDFFDELENFEFQYKNENGNTVFTKLKDEFPNWRRTLSDLYDIRNKFVHEGIPFEFVKQESFSNFYSTVANFELIMEDYFDKKYYQS